MYAPGIFHGVRFSENERHADRHECFSLDVFSYAFLVAHFSLFVFSYAFSHGRFSLSVFE